MVARGRTLELGATGHLMAIINVTPDSFSDGGRYDGLDAVVAQALACVRDGATILDIGGESTRPGAAEISATEEQDRVLPVIERLANETDALISIDTYRARTASLALAAGAHIVNDVHGLQRDPDMASVVAGTAAGVCIMHTGRGREDRKPDLVDDQFHFLGRSLDISREAGIAQESIMLDPGFGFAKDRDDDLELIARFGELHRLGFPLLAGTSRKRFIGAVTGREKPAERDVGTAATTVMLRLAGAAIFRVHDVATNRDALAVADAVIAAIPKDEARAG